MKKINIVKKNNDFSLAIKNGKYISNSYFSIYIYKTDLNVYRFGISIGKKIGNAVKRNKIKRQLRSIVDFYRNDYQNGYDYIIIVRNSYDESSYNEMKEKFIQVIKKLNKGGKDEK